MLGINTYQTIKEIAMKKIIYTLTLLSALWLVGCDKDEEKVILSSEAQVTTTISPSSVVLEKANDEKTALTVDWQTNHLNVQVAPTYNVVFSYNNKEKKISVTTSPKAFTVNELNNIVTELGMKAGETSDLTVSVELQVSDQFSLPTQKQVVKITPYADLIKPTEWGVVGSATPKGWDGPDVPFWRVVGDDTHYVAYITLKDGEIKFRKNNKWEEDFGDNGADGTLEKGGANISVSQGIYRVLWNTKDNTYKKELYTWGIVGDGANGWDADKGTDIPLTYDGETNSWKAQSVTLKDGQIKFRLNNKWETNYGADSDTEPEPSQSGDAKASGKNIKSSAGTYNITFSFDEKTQKGTYKIEKL